MAEMTIRYLCDSYKVTECKYLKLKIDSKADFDMTEFKYIPNQLDRVAQIVSRLEFVSRNNRMQGLIGSITTA